MKVIMQPSGSEIEKKESIQMVLDYFKGKLKFTKDKDIPGRKHISYADIHKYETVIEALEFQLGNDKTI